ncbi:phage protein NinX family protein [Proteus mirabilis]|uniref:phage protein NinX family protein n=1 Tax=Proteus mirabilis TaxID=584 RepID=UPI0034D66AFE
MNKYTEMSDFEINKKVAEALGLISEVTHYGTVAKSTKKGHWFKFDPCNNPADAMPIIIENGISIMFDTGCNAWVAGIADWVDGCEWQVSPEIERMNPLRAAMEVFLMIKDAENEKV